MLGQSGYSRAMLPNVRDIERRLRSLELQLERVGDRTSGSTAEIAERVGAAIAPVLSSIADRFRGGAHSMGLGGRMEEGFGQATGDVKAQVEGKAKQAEDAVQDAYGQVKETASDAVEAIRESASGAQDFLRTTIEERPYTAAAVALGIGYLIGRFSRRDN
jgi:uncharacterized protein YjbJ (UPF0337 family)